MCQEEKNAKNNFKPGFLMKEISELSHFRTAIFQNGTKKLLKNILRSSLIADCE
jgi:hypothetical protein